MNNAQGKNTGSKKSARRKSNNTRSNGRKGNKPNSRRAYANNSGKQPRSPYRNQKKSLIDEEFEKLVTIHPEQRLKLEIADDLSTRIIDLIAPIGKGQRGMIVSPPRAGKTSILKSIARAICTNYPEITVLTLLVDERPEEITDMCRSGFGEVIFSSFDESDSNHIKIAEKTMKRAKELVVKGKDVVILLDSITRLARAYNTYLPASGKLLSGGVDSKALFKPKKYFGAARAIEDGGSLTIIGTALVDTGSRLDEVIFEEFKGTGNMELHLDRRLTDMRVFPSIDISKSGTRKEELLLTEDELKASRQLRKQFYSLDVATSMEMLIDKMQKTSCNKDFLQSLA